MLYNAALATGRTGCMEEAGGRKRLGASGDVWTSDVIRAGRPRGRHDPAVPASSATTRLLPQLTLLSCPSRPLCLFTKCCVCRSSQRCARWATPGSHRQPGSPKCRVSGSTASSGQTFFPLSSVLPSRHLHSQGSLVISLRMRSLLCTGQLSRRRGSGTPSRE